jgi:hypothetical protein
MKFYKILLFISSIILLFGNHFPQKPMDENIYCEIRCCNGNSIFDRSIKLTEEGLICKNPDKLLENKPNERILFIDFLKLNQRNLNELQYFLSRNDFFSYDSVYICADLVLDGSQQTIILRRKDDFKKIIYSECYHPQLDSIFNFMNNLLPKHERKNYEVNGNNNEYHINIECITEKNKK